MVSVVIPVYNGAAYVAEAVRSSLEQTTPPREVIVVDDGSTDGTIEALAPYLSQIRLLRLSRGGLAVARNTGAQVASGRYIALMDADDIMLSTRIEAQANALSRFPELGLVSSDFMLVAEDGELLSESHIHDYYDALGRVGGVAAAYPASTEGVSLTDGTSLPVLGGDLSSLLVWGNFVHPPTVMVRRDLYTALGGLDASLGASWDYEFIVRASRRAVFGYIPAPLLRYRRSAGQISRSRVRGEAHLATVEILARHARAKAALTPADRQAIRRKSAESRMEAAYKLAAFDRTAALRHWLRAVSSEPLVPGSARAMARIVLPASIQGWIRRTLRRA